MICSRLSDGSRLQHWHGEKGLHTETTAFYIKTLQRISTKQLEEYIIEIKMSACEIFFCLRAEKDIASISRVTEDADSGFSLQERTNHSSWQLFFVCLYFVLSIVNIMKTITVVILSSLYSLCIIIAKNYLSTHIVIIHHCLKM